MIFLSGVLIAVSFLLKVPPRLVRPSSDIRGWSDIAIVFPLKRVCLGDCAAVEPDASASSPGIYVPGLGVLTKAVLVSAEDSMDSAVNSILSCDRAVGMGRERC